MAGSLIGKTGSYLLWNLINGAFQSETYTFEDLNADFLRLKRVEQNVQSADYTLTLSDQAKQIYHPASDTVGRTWTIPSNTSVAFPIGTSITMINMSVGSVTIHVDTDTMYVLGTGTTGDRTLSQFGMCTLLKISATEWMISGSMA